MSKKILAKTDYTVAWVCALPHEMAFVMCILEEEHENLEKQETSDHNNYQLGRIHNHNIVIASLSASMYDMATTTTVAKDILRTFTSIRFDLMIDIDGTVSSSNYDICLDDVVVSESTRASEGVVQYDREKMISEGKFQRTESLNSSSIMLLTALSRLKAKHERSDNGISQFLNEMYQKYFKIKKSYAFSRTSHDQLYKTNYDYRTTQHVRCVILKSQFNESLA